MVGAKCYFYCKPHCSNSMRNLMKVELTTVPRPPASSCWRSQNWRRVEKLLEEALNLREGRRCVSKIGNKMIVKDPQFKREKDWEMEREAEQEGDRALSCLSHHPVAPWQQTLAILIGVVTSGTWQTSSLCRLDQTPLQTPQQEGNGSKGIPSH